MKNTDKASMDYARNYGLNNLTMANSFKAGAKFAQIWYNFEDELPPLDKDLLLKDIFGNYALGKMVKKGARQILVPTIDSDFDFIEWRLIELD